jgi:hypothetical protein
VADALFLTILARRPTTGESKIVHEQISGSDMPAEVWREIAWALLLSSEFSMNH